MSSSVAITRRPVKHARLRVRENEMVELVAPADFTEAQVAEVIERKAAWIDRQLAFFRTRPAAPSPSPGNILLLGESFKFVRDPNLRRQVQVDESAKTIRAGPDLTDPATLNKWYRPFARRYLAARTAELAKKHDLPYGRVFIRSQRKKWGNCSTDGNISLNWRLVTAPCYVADYLILHELLHTRIMNHTHRFWAHLNALCPDHKMATAWLQSNRSP